MSSSLVKITKVNKHLVNIALLFVIIILANYSKDIWNPILNKILLPTLPFIIGFIIAYCAQPFINIIEEKVNNRKIATLILTAILVFIGFLFYYFVILTLIRNMPTMIDDIVVIINELAVKFDIDQQVLDEFLLNIFDKTFNPIVDFLSVNTLLAISWGINALTYIGITVIVTISFLIGWEKLEEEYVELAHKMKPKHQNFLSALNEKLTDYVFSQIILIVFMSIQYSILFLIIGHNYWLVCGILAGVLSIIPIFGGIIAGVVGVFLAILQGPKTIVLSLIVVAVIPQFDAAVTQPRIVGNKVNIRPNVTLFAFLLGGSLLGFVGMVICIPVSIVIQLVFEHYKDSIKTTFKSVRDSI